MRGVRNGFENFADDMFNAGVGALSSFLTAELFESLGIDGTVGELGQQIVANQLTDGTVFSLLKLERVCDASDLAGSGVEHPGAWLACFQVRTKLPLLDGSVEPTFTGLFSTSAFGTEQLATRRRYGLCVPAVRLP